MPFPLVALYGKMLPRLEAEESLKAVQIAAMGAGLMSESDQIRIRSEWVRLAKSNNATGKKIGKEHHKFMLASMGIGVKCPKV